MQLPRNFLPISLPLIGFAFLGALFYLRIFAGDPEILPSALIGRQIPQFNLPPLEKSGVPGLASADLMKKRVTLVNIWASWCVPCRAEHPLLMQLAEKSKTGHFEVAGLNYKDQPQAALKFLKEEGNPYARIGADTNGRTGIDWGVYGVPETFIVDGMGKILFKHVGPLTERTLQRQIMPFLKE